MRFAWGTALNVLLAMMALLYGSFISKAVWDNILHPPTVPAVNITHAVILEPVQSEGAIDVLLMGSVTGEICEQCYLLGSVVDNKDNEVRLDKIISLGLGAPQNLLNKPISINMPSLTPGDYRLRVELHEICNKKSFVILVPLIPFTVVASANFSK